MIRGLYVIVGLADGLRKSRGDEHCRDKKYECFYQNSFLTGQKTSLRGWMACSGALSMPAVFTFNFQDFII